MGYTHYWNTEETEVFKAGMKKALPYIEKILERHKDIICYESDQANKEHELNEYVCRFNGIEDDGHETFYISPSDSGFNFCKTARKLYDIAVCECLIVYNHFLPNFDLSSDGFGGFVEDKPDGFKNGDIVNSPDGCWGEATDNVKRMFPEIDYNIVCTDKDDSPYYGSTIEKVN